MPIQSENSASQETIWNFDLNTVSGILNMIELESKPNTELRFSHNSNPTTNILTNAPSGLLTLAFATCSNSCDGGM
jgi:hypothetical protein